jgi:hypothetical protein
MVAGFFQLLRRHAAFRDPPGQCPATTAGGLPDEKTRRRLQRLGRRLLDITVQLDRITTAENEERWASQLTYTYHAWPVNAQFSAQFSPDSMESVG